MGDVEWMSGCRGEMRRRSGLGVLAMLIAFVSVLRACQHGVLGRYERGYTFEDGLGWWAACVHVERLRCLERARMGAGNGGHRVLIQLCLAP